MRHGNGSNSVGKNQLNWQKKFTDVIETQTNIITTKNTYYH